MKNSIHGVSQDMPEEAPSPASQRAGADILIVTGDDIFLANARKVVAEPNRLWHAANPVQAADLLASQPCAVIVLDAALVQPRLQEVIARLRGQFPDLACVIAGEQKDEPEAAALLVSGIAQGFVFKQHAVRQLAKVLSAGIDSHFELQIEAARRSGGGGKRFPLVAAIGFAAAAAIALGAWLALHGGHEQSAAARPTPPVRVSAPPPALKAEQTIQRNEAVEKAAQQAQEVDALLARTEASLMAGAPRDAAAALKLAKTLAPEHPRIAFLDAQIARELNRLSAEQKAAAQAELTRQQLAELLSREQERAEREQREAEQKLEAELQQAAAEKARAAAQAAAAAAAQVQAQAPAAKPVETPEQLKARRQAELLAKPSAMQASMIVKQVLPQYPADAQRQGIEGYVDLQFTVSDTGEVKDAAVIGAAPKHTFEEASLRAIRKWKFKPKQIDGEPYEQRLWLRMTFKPGA